MTDKCILDEYLTEEEKYGMHEDIGAVSDLVEWRDSEYNRIAI